MDLLKEKTGIENEIEVKFKAVSRNESFARIAVAAFATPLNPTMEEIADLKTAVSEAVTNAIIHGYGNDAVQDGIVKMILKLHNNEIEVVIQDTGVGIADVTKAMEPLFTTRPDAERSGMGFSFMEAFMDELHVDSVLGEGTTITMRKCLGHKNIKWNNEV